MNPKSRNRCQIAVSPANIAYLPNIFNIKRIPEHMSGHGLCCKIVQLKHLFISQWGVKRDDTLMIRLLLYQFHKSSRCISAQYFSKCGPGAWNLSEMQFSGPPRPLDQRLEWGPEICVLTSLPQMTLMHASEFENYCPQEGWGVETEKKYSRKQPFTLIFSNFKMLSKHD